MKWNEPRFADNYALKQLRFKDYLLAVGKRCLIVGILAYAGMLLLLWLSPARGKSLSFFDLKLLGFALCFTAGYLLIWFLVSFASMRNKPQISLLDKGISIVAIVGGEYTCHSVAYQELKSFCIIKTNIEDIEFFVLALKNWDDIKRNSSKLIRKSIKN